MGRKYKIIQKFDSNSRLIAEYTHSKPTGFDAIISFKNDNTVIGGGIGWTLDGIQKEYYTNGKPKKEWFESNVLSWPEKKDKIKNKKEWDEKGNLTLESSVNEIRSWDDKRNLRIQTPFSKNGEKKRLIKYYGQNNVLIREILNKRIRLGDPLFENIRITDYYDYIKVWDEKGNLIFDRHNFQANQDYESLESFTESTEKKTNTNRNISILELIQNERNLFNKTKQSIIDFNNFTNLNSFFTYKKIEKWKLVYVKLYNKLNQNFNDISKLPKSQIDEIKKFKDLYITSNDLRNEQNKEYIICELKLHKDYFDELGEFPLTDEQREAIVADDNFILAAKV